MNAIVCEVVVWACSDAVVTSQLVCGWPTLRHVVSSPVGTEPSLSVIVNVRPAGADTPLPPDAAPETVTVLSAAASTLLFTAVSVTAPVLAVEPAAMTSALFVLSA